MISIGKRYFLIRFNEIELVDVLYLEESDFSWIMCFIVKNIQGKFMLLEEKLPYGKT